MGFARRQHAAASFDMRVRTASLIAASCRTGQQRTDNKLYEDLRNNVSDLMNVNNVLRFERPACVSQALE